MKQNRQMQIRKSIRNGNVKKRKINRKENKRKEVKGTGIGSTNSCQIKLVIIIHFTLERSIYPIFSFPS